MRTEGWCVIDGVIPRPELAAVRDSVSATLAGRTELRGVIACDRSFAPYLVDERLTAIAMGMFGPESRIARTDAFAVEPGAAGTGWHADWPFSGDDSYRVAVPYGDLAMAVTTLWMLTDAPADAGATLIASGSHRTHDNPAVAHGYAADAEIASQMLPEVPAGSVLAFDSRLWHRTTANTGGERRFWLDIQYVPWWLDVTSMIPRAGGLRDPRRGARLPAGGDPPARRGGLRGPAGHGEAAVRPPAPRPGRDRVASGRTGVILNSTSAIRRNAATTGCSSRRGA